MLRGAEKNYKKLQAEQPDVRLCLPNRSLRNYCSRIVRFLDFVRRLMGPITLLLIYLAPPERSNGRWGYNIKKPKVKSSLRTT